MRKYHGGLLLAAHDLDRFLGCAHATVLDLCDLEEPLPKAEEDGQLALLREKGFEHERRYLEALKGEGLRVVQIKGSGALGERVRETRAAMESGADIVYQGALYSGKWHGYADFLRLAGRDRAGRPLYEAVDTKLARRATPAHIMQLCVYTGLLAEAQGTEPQSMYIILGDGREEAFRFADFAAYYRIARRRFETFVSAAHPESRPEPCRACDSCRWRERCEAQWEREDHLSLVANIRRTQVDRLQSAGIGTVRALASLPDEAPVAGMAPEALERLRSQAQLQVTKRDSGENRVELLPLEEGRGFARMPRPDPGDLFLDFEGDPLYPDGLEYLMGVYFVEEGKGIFRPFWAHDHEEERAAFERLSDFFTRHLQDHPGAHIYHYNHYEETALKRLASGYGTREDSVDRLLRGRKLVDLYKVVREGVRVSEPRYSLKNLEAFYMEGRAGEVKTAGDSIVVYEKWRATGDAPLLAEIAEYNEIDCRSTALLRDWLLGLRPPDVPWPEAAEEPEEEKAAAREEAELRRSECERRLLERAPAAEVPARNLTAQLLEFHRREAKPQWWAMFDRQGRREEELVEDAECLAGLRLHPRIAPVQEKRSIVYTYTFPPQDTKLRAGDTPLDSDRLEPAGTILSVDEERRTVRIKRGMQKGELPERLSLVPAGPIDQRVLRDAVYRHAEAMVSDPDRYRAVRALLMREPPRISGHAPGVPVVRDAEETLAQAIDAVSRLDESCLFIQGPPGSGKTYTSSHIIVELLRQGRRVGVAANSHKAIHNLLAAVERRAVETGFSFRGIKKSTANEETWFGGRFVEDVTDNGRVDPEADLIAGTAWLFAREEFDQKLDFLFVDEAGQVSLANMVAMGLAARNLVLVGDQMQLAQPIQGVHPGESGLSVLDYLLEGAPTIPPERGIFLGTTWRMHDEVCRFISEVVYDGRLHPEPGTRNQRVLLGADAHPDLAPTGIRFVPVEHRGCSQKSEEEGRVIREIYGSLLLESFRDRNGKEHPFGTENILVVSPYNVQVNHLRSVLPAGARVGTVDKFQGQEAEVVLVSMATSGAEDLPRDIEFLYSRNRLNVALSRARSLALVAASPRLLEIPCATVEQMRLVNTLCRVADGGHLSF
ncbi:MAG: TM0106 family RecB-like putative nuclease [Acidobacteria bacterium]|nr:TM0106 family RecB-like putative nuclease [Acidobacteriota bacterium]